MGFLHINAIFKFVYENMFHHKSKENRLYLLWTLKKNIKVNCSQNVLKIK